MIYARIEARSIGAPGRPVLANETGAANHEAYKQRQREAAQRRIRLGMRLDKDSNPPKP